MTAQRRTAAALSGLALLAFAPFAGGCGPIFETNEAACVRMTTYFLTCGSPADAPPEFDFFIAQICAPVPETSECDDWPAFADCVTSVSCTDLFSFAAELEEMCGDLEAGLKNNGCVP